jgi:hypothetical protein
MIEDKCEVLINGSGVLKYVWRQNKNAYVRSDSRSSEWKYPDIPGIKDFEGKLMHSAKWDSSYDLSGKTVAVIGKKLFPHGNGVISC